MNFFDACLYWLTGLLPRKLIGFCALRVWTWASVERPAGRDGVNVTCLDALETWDRRTGSKLGVAFGGAFAAVLFYFGVMLVLGGCATRRVVAKPTPSVAGWTGALVKDAAEVDALEAVAPVEQAWVRVKKGDTLWALADSRLGSPWYWPLIWKANRDFIAEPDWIDEGEWLNTPASGLGAEGGWAFETAQGWNPKGYPRSIKKP